MRAGVGEVTHEQARDIIRIAWEGAFAGKRFETMLLYISQREAAARETERLCDKSKEMADKADAVDHFEASLKLQADRTQRARRDTR